MSQPISFGQGYFSSKKIDILFFDSISKLKQNLAYSVIYQLNKVLTLLIFIPLNYSIVSGVHEQEIKIALILLFVGSILQLIYFLLYRFLCLRNNQLIINLASSMGHATDQQIIGQIQELQNCVSKKMYNQQNLTQLSSQGLTLAIKKSYTGILSSNIKEMIVRSYPCINKFQTFAQFIGFSSLVYGVIAISVYQSNTPQLVVIIIILILEALSKILIILVVLFIGLLPVLCLIFCFFCCCCTNPQTGQVRLPSEEVATEKMITEADGTCSICYQNFIVGEKVVRLKCSGKHMFHVLCISGWAKLKPTCPICRAAINSQSFERV